MKGFLSISGTPANSLDVSLKNNSKGDALYSVINFVLTLLLIVCLFDPADVARLKISLFCIIWILSIWRALRDDCFILDRELLLYVIFFIAIPTISVVFYILTHNTESYKGISQLKGFLFITLAPLLVLNKVELIDALITIFLLIFPIWQTFRRQPSPINNAIAIGYIFYLIMCATNPNLFNSVGMLFVSLILSLIYIQKQNALLLAEGDKRD